MTDEELMIDAIDHLRAAAESISKLRTSSNPSLDSSLNSGSSPSSILAERCMKGLDKLEYAGKISPEQTEKYSVDILRADHVNDTKTLNLILGQLLKLYRS